MTNAPHFYWWGFNVKPKWGAWSCAQGTMIHLGWLDVKVIFDGP